MADRVRDWRVEPEARGQSDAGSDAGAVADQLSGKGEQAVTESQRTSKSGQRKLVAFGKTAREWALK